MNTSPAIPDHIKKFMHVFTHAGFEIYIVGGAVRNLLLKRPVDNWDFTTNAHPEDIQKLFDRTRYDNTYGTVTYKDDTTSDLYEVTPFRNESSYADHRHPSKIEWAHTLEVDVQRRDFTINALAHDGTKIIDLVDGLKDLKNSLIRCVGTPSVRFNEDALRLIRAVRLAAQLGFMIEEETRNAIVSSAPLILTVSWERIRDEFFKILESDHPSEGVLFLRSTSLLAHILPELDQCFSVPQKSPKRHHVYDVGTHQVLSLKACPSKDPLVRFASLIHDIGKLDTFAQDEQTGLITFYNHEVVGAQKAQSIAIRFRLSKKQREKLVSLVRHHMFSVSELQTDKAIRRFIRTVGRDNLSSMLDLRTADRIGSGASPTSWRTEQFKTRLKQVQKKPFSITDLTVNGKDVMKALDIPPGPKVGTILQSLFEKVANAEVPNKKTSLLKLLSDLNS